MAAVVDQEFAVAEATLLALATSPSLAAHDWPRLYGQASELLSGKNEMNIVLADDNGRQYLNTLRGIDAAASPHTSLRRMHLVHETGQTVISNVFIGPMAPCTGPRRMARDAWCWPRIN